VEALESRELFSGGASTIHLYDSAGSPGVVDTHKAVWLLFHGLNMSKDNMTTLSGALQAARPADQVLIVDWSALASTDGATKSAPRSHARITADWAAQLLTNAGIRTSRVNLIGFSMGGEVIADLAQELHTRHAMVNRIVAIDSAGSNGISYADESSYSIAFTAADRSASLKAAESADDTVLLTGLPADDGQRHGATFGLYNTLVLREAGLESAPNDHVSSVFSTTNLMSGNLPAWKKDAFDGMYEAEVSCQAVAGSAWRYEPVSLTYFSRVNSRRRTV
jgi:pimeloyl-ACP methyl ester carboxylesterase